jgi:hypothetical protein
LQTFLQGWRARLPGKAAGQGCLARLPGKAAGQGCRARLPGKSAGKVCRASLQGKSARQGRQASLPGKAAGQGCRARLPSKAAGQGYMHVMAQYAEQLKTWWNWSKMQNSEQIRRNKNNNNNNKAKLRPALYERTNAGKKVKAARFSTERGPRSPHGGGGVGAFRLYKKRLFSGTKVIHLVVWWCRKLKKWFRFTQFWSLFLPSAQFWLSQYRRLLKMDKTSLDSVSS